MLPMSHSKLRMSNAQGNEFFTLHSSLFVLRLTDAKVQHLRGEINFME